MTGASIQEPGSAETGYEREHHPKPPRVCETLIASENFFYSSFSADCRVLNILKMLLIPFGDFGSSVDSFVLENASETEAYMNKTQ